MNLRRVLDRLAERLRDADVSFAVIGGLALAAHGAARATIDLDLLVAGEDAERLHGILSALGYEALLRSENVANYAGKDPEAGRVDVLFVRRPLGRAILSRAPARGDRALNPDRALVEASDEELAASRRAVEAWQRAHPVSFPQLLAWIDSLRAVFGDPPVDRSPTVGDDYRI